MASREEVLFLCVYLFLLFLMYIISEVIMGVKVPRDFLLFVNETVNISRG